MEHDRDPEDILFAPDRGNKAGARAAFEDDWLPPAASNLESFLAAEEPVSIAGLQPEAQTHRNPLPGAVEPRYEAAPRDSGQPSGVTSSRREALPTVRDAPPPPMAAEDGPVAIPALAALVGCSVGAFLCVAEANYILGGMTVALSVVGALLIRQLLRR
ncbi:MAG: hypothetical protein KDC87_19375 [Planctomycetes bacterium]|nr:hypothetical protein [Planctomycetota bacterium]MCB9868513.1 hypothetical protein [Planctomycetota bacterium]